MEVSELSSCCERMGSSWKCSGKCWKDTSCAEISASFLGGNEGLRPWSAETSWKGIKGSGFELDTQSFLRVAEGWINQLGKSSVAQEDLNRLRQWTAEISPWLQLCCSHIIVQTQFVGSMFLNIHRNCQHSPGLLPTPKIQGWKMGPWSLATLKNGHLWP